MRFQKKINFILLFLFSVLLFSCNSGDKLNITNKNFGEEINLKQNLIFTFNHNLISDSLLNNWDSTAYIKFEPEVKGKFKWTATDELTFSPDFGFQPATDYKATLSTDLFKNNKSSNNKLSLGDEKTINFHTPYLNVQKVNAYWIKDKSGSAQIKYQFAFNYPVNPTEVANNTTITTDGEKVNLKPVNTNLSDQIVLVTDAKKSFQTKDSEIAIKEGLKTEKGKALKTQIKLNTQIPNIDPLKISNIETDYVGETGIIYVYANQTFAQENLKDYIKIDPVMDFTIEKQEYGCIIKGSFKPGSYSLTFSHELSGVFGSKLGEDYIFGNRNEDYTQVVAFGEMQPQIEFTSKNGLYLTSKGSKNIGVNIIGLEKVRVSVYKIYENNILPFTRQGNYIEDYGSYNTDSEEYVNENSNNNPFGDVVSEKIVNVKDLRKEGGIYYLNMNIKEINDFKGMYAVKVSSIEQNWVSASKMVSVSDIGMIVKETEDEIFVFTNSILTAKPLSKLTVKLVSSNNQTISTAETDADGIAKFSEIKKTAPNFKIKLITVSEKEDFNFLLFDDNKVETSRYEVGGAHENASGYQAFLYGERDMYRPGETMNINTIIRDKAWKTVGEMPVKIKVVSPMGKEFTTLKGNLNKQSSFATSVTFPSAAVTGNYSLEVYTANDVMLASKNVNVEEFLPDRIKVNVAIPKKEYKPGETIDISATALNLFGPPAANRNYEITYNLHKKEFSSVNFSDYNFSISGNDNVSFEQIQRQGSTDENGILKESLKIPDSYQGLGILQGTVFTTVFDESGRPVNRANRIDVITQDVFYGIKYFDSYSGTGTKIDIPLIAVNKDGKALSASANVKIIKSNYETVLQKDNNGSIRYISQKKEQLMEDKTIKLNSTTTLFSYIPQLSGEYEVRISNPGSKSYVKQNFYAYGYGVSSNSFEVDKEGQIIIQADKKKYKTGEKAKLLFKTPFEGKMLISIERDKVYEKYFVTTDKKSASFDINLKAEHLPNVYVTATLIKPLSDGAIPLTVAHGFVSIDVEDEDYKLPVELISVEKSLSKTKQTIRVKTKPNAEVTLAIVDEGILQLKDYQSPNPFAYFFQKKALQVNAYDLYPRLFPELNDKKSSTGGDGAMKSALAGRTNPLSNKRVNLVSFWSGTITANGSGEAVYTIDVPQFSGDLRIMAVAYKDNAFGSAQKNMKVADPIIISTSLPRFLSPGDNIIMPVTLSNTTNQVATAKAVLKLSGELSVEGNQTQSVKIPANSEAQVSFTINAAQNVGYGEVEVFVNALNQNFSDKTDITIRPIQSLLKTSGSGAIQGGKNSSFTLAGDYIPASTKAKLVVSKSPITQFAQNLDDLLNYPYGCVEQTVSTAFPQIYFSDLSKTLHKFKKPTFFQVANKSMKQNAANVNVQQAINKLSAMQLGNGALSYWPEGGKESWWGTAYAAHFMIEARKAGFEVPRSVLNKMLEYLKAQARNRKNQEEYFFYDGNNVRKTKFIAPKEIAYSLYVIALGSKADMSTMNYYKSNKNLLAIDSKYLLGAAYFLTGDNGSYRSLVPASFSNERSETALGGSFYSFIRDEAISLNALLDTDPQNVQIPIMVKHLSDAIKRSHWLNTQENAFGLLALGKFARKNNQTQVNAQITAGGKNIATFSNEDISLATGLANKNVNIQTNGTGSLYYFWQAEGLSTSNIVKEEDSYLKVRKTFYDRSGRQLSGSTFRQNDLIVVKMELITTDGSSVENVVITDMLPAGFEIENPRIAESPEMTWASKNAFIPEHLDIRDDRINIFATATGQVKTFYYVVRAVSKGKFKMGPVSADAMYNGEYHSINGAGNIIVIDRNAIEENKEEVKNVEGK